MKEVWKGLIYDGKNYSEWIEISNLGRVRNPKTTTIRKQNLLKSGYCFVSFSMGSRNKKKTFRVHKGLAETFIANPENKPYINHKDGNKINNSLNNLEWVTAKENTTHAYSTGLIVPKEGQGHYKAKFSEEQIRFIRKNHIKSSSKHGALALSKMFNVSASTMQSIVNYETYKNIL